MNSRSEPPCVLKCELTIYCLDGLCQTGQVRKGISASAGHQYILFAWLPTALPSGVLPGPQNQDLRLFSRARVSWSTSISLDVHSKNAASSSSFVWTWKCIFSGIGTDFIHEIVLIVRWVWLKMVAAGPGDNSSLPDRMTSFRLGIFAHTAWHFIPGWIDQCGVLEIGSANMKIPGWLFELLSAWAQMIYKAGEDGVQAG
jgi:hypothetical protein